MKNFIPTNRTLLLLHIKHVNMTILLYIIFCLTINSHDDVTYKQTSVTSNVEGVNKDVPSRASK